MRPYSDGRFCYQFHMGNRYIGIPQWRNSLKFHGWQNYSDIIWCILYIRRAVPYLMVSFSTVDLILRSFGIALFNMIHDKKVLLFVRARGMRPLLTQSILEDPNSADSADDSTSGTTNFIPPYVSRNRISIRSIRNSGFWSQAKKTQKTYISFFARMRNHKKHEFHFLQA